MLFFKIQSTSANSNTEGNKRFVRMFELTNGFYKGFLSKGIKIWFELAKVRITRVQINGY